MNKNKVFIYEIRDNNSKPIYVGVTSNLKRRLQEHKTSSICKSKPSYDYHLYRKIRKLKREGKYNVALHVVECHGSLEKAYEREIFWINKYREQGITLCNLTDGGDGGHGHSPCFNEQWRTKLSKAMKKRIKRDGNPFQGRKHSKESLKKMSRSQKRLDKSGHRNPFYGCNHTDETKMKISMSNKGKTKGVPKQDAHKKKISMAHQGKEKPFNRGRKNYMVKPVLFTLPNGEEFIWLDGFNQLVNYLKEKYNISTAASTLSSVTNHQRTSKQGWRCRFINLLQSSNE